MADENLFSIHILGDTFSIKVDQDREYMNSLIRYVEDKIEETERLTNLKDPLRIAVLSSILIADDLFKTGRPGLAGMSEAESEEAARVTHNIIDLIDQSLKNGP